jgi:two-component system, OmpR family, response regulator
MPRIVIIIHEREDRTDLSRSTVARPILRQIWPMIPKSPLRILIVDDQQAIRLILRSGLEADDYIVSEAGGKAELLHCLETEPVDLITLDLDLGGEDGLQLAREVRARRNIPIIMITGKGEPVDRVAGLEHGADDYIVKPFHIKEVRMRIRNVLRRYALETETRGGGAAISTAEERYKFAIGTLHVQRRELVAESGDLIDLTDTEFGLLMIFLGRPARIMSRDELVALLNGRHWSPEDRSIDGHIARLRRKIDLLGGGAARLIKSVRGIGYVFTGDVQRLPNS